MKLIFIVEAKAGDFEKLYKNKTRLQKYHSRIKPLHKILGFDGPLDKVAEGSFATLYQHPLDDSKLIKITTHEEDVKNTVKAQKINSDNVVKIYSWPDKTFVKALPEFNAWATIVEKISGSPMRLSTGHFYKLCYNGKFEFAKDWLNAGGSPEQINVLKLYNMDNDHEMAKFAQLFDTLHELSRYRIDLSDFDENVIDDGSKYVIIDLGF